jgi:hypothetical protein
LLFCGLHVAEARDVPGKFEWQLLLSFRQAGWTEFLSVRRYVLYVCTFAVAFWHVSWGRFCIVDETTMGEVAMLWSWRWAVNVQSLCHHHEKCLIAYSFSSKARRFLLFHYQKSCTSLHSKTSNHIFNSPSEEAKTKFPPCLVLSDCTYSVSAVVA